MGVWPGSRTAEYVEGAKEVNPNGVDIGVSEVWKIPDEGSTVIHGDIREVSPEKVKLDADGDFYVLEHGVYELRLGAKVRIPDNACGLLVPRSTLNRFGIIKSETALWDSGYSGHGTQTIFVAVKELKIHKDEMWFQLLFLDAEASGAYDGHWQGEEPE